MEKVRRALIRITGIRNTLLNTAIGIPWSHGNSHLMAILFSYCFHSLYFSFSHAFSLVLHDFKPNSSDLLGYRRVFSYFSYSGIYWIRLHHVPHPFVHIPGVRHMFAYSAVPSTPFFILELIYWNVPHSISSLLQGTPRKHWKLSGTDQFGTNRPGPLQL